MSRLQMVPITVNGTDFELTTEDLGSYFKVSVYKDGKYLGTRQIGHLVDTEIGTMRYIVKSILEGGRHGLLKKTTQGSTLGRA